MGFNKILLVAMLAISIVFVSMTSFILSVGSNYNVSVPSQYQNLLNKQKDIDALNAQNQQIIESGNINPQGFGAAAYTNSIVASKQAGQSLGLFQALLFETPLVFGIEVSLIFMIGSIVVVLVGFAFIELLSGRSP